MERGHMELKDLERTHVESWNWREPNGEKMGAKKLALICMYVWVV